MAHPELPRKQAGHWEWDLLKCCIRVWICRAAKIEQSYPCWEWSQRLSIQAYVKMDQCIPAVYIFWHFGHLMWRADSLEKTLRLGKIEGRRRRGWQRMRWLDGIIDLMNMSLSKLQGIMKKKPGVLLCVGSQKFGHWATEQQQGEWWKTTP